MCRLLNEFWLQGCEALNSRIFYRKECRWVIDLDPVMVGFDFGLWLFSFYSDVSWRVLHVPLFVALEWLLQFKLNLLLRRRSHLTPLLAAVCRDDVKVSRQDWPRGKKYLASASVVQHRLTSRRADMRYKQLEKSVVFASQQCTYYTWSLLKYEHSLEPWCEINADNYS